MQNSAKFDSDQNFMRYLESEIWKKKTVFGQLIKAIDEKLTLVICSSNTDARHKQWDKCIKIENFELRGAISNINFACNPYTHD